MGSMCQMRFGDSQGQGCFWDACGEEAFRPGTNASKAAMVAVIRGHFGMLMNS